MTSLVTVAEVKAHLNFPSADVTHDTEIQGFIDGCQPVIENITGPIVQQTYTSEAYDGGAYSIVVRHRPIVSISSVIEYRGTIAYTLTQVANPSLGTPWSYIYEPSGRITRMGVGRPMQFPTGFGTVQVSYIAGQASTPANVKLAMLELVRHNYQMSQQAGRPAFPQSYGAEDAPYVPSGYAVPTRVLELLAPNRRGPSIA